jgi:ferredoxin
VVDLPLCDLHGECVFRAPEVFEIDESTDTLHYSETPPEELRAKVLEAARACPVTAITVED